jgi:N-acetylglucosamine kinase-like BadF-type ATPase
MDPARPLLLGVDGGNTKTIALVATADGSIVGSHGIRRASDIYAVPVETAMAVLEEVVAGAVAGAGASATDVRGAAFSLAGADWPEDITLLSERLHASWPGATVVNDGIGALRAAIPDGPGVVVVCGTGTATGARGADGRTWHSSFWQEPQSAHELGTKALQAVVRADLGIDPPTALRARLLEATGERDVEGMLHHATGRVIADRRDPAGLAGVLLDVADEGDQTAAAIVRRHGTALGQTALAAARRVGLTGDDPFVLALSGGLLRHPAVTLRAAVVDTVRAGAPGVILAPASLEPAVGALLLAFDRAGIDASPSVEARLRATMPAAALFDSRIETGGRPR